MSFSEMPFSFFASNGSGTASCLPTGTGFGAAGESPPNAVFATAIVAAVAANVLSASRRVVFMGSPPRRHRRTPDGPASARHLPQALRRDGGHRRLHVVRRDEARHRDADDVVAAREDRWRDPVPFAADDEERRTREVHVPRSAAARV